MNSSAHTQGWRPSPRSFWYWKACAKAFTNAGSDRVATGTEPPPKLRLDRRAPLFLT